jgi:hypothetical protein
MDLKIPKKHKQEAEDIQAECHRIVDAINDVLEGEEEVHGND